MKVDKIKEKIQEICIEDGIDFISFGKDTFTVNFGDVENVDTEGNKYWLLETYVEIPYNFYAASIRLHRGIVDVLECHYERAKKKEYHYSGFVHYSGDSFCYGESGVDKCCSNIRTEDTFKDLNSDTFNMLLIKFRVYLSNSSHGSGHGGGFSSYRKLDLVNESPDITHNLKETVEIDGVILPSFIEKIEKQAIFESIDYESPYEVLYENVNKKFTYNNEVITPKVVKHKTVGKTKVDKQNVRVNVPYLLKEFENKQIDNIRNEVNNQSEFTVEAFIH
tara:strand:+ start:714 stop:1547 length:834 start_codon:yes stop_codon:yes gene_type:complete